MSGARPKALFVYGTLRKGEARSGCLKPCRLARVVKIPGALYLTRFGYPACVLGEPSSPGIWGELYDLPGDSESFMEEIDRVEGVGEGLFSRSAARHGGDFFYVYEAGPKIRGKIRGEDLLESGNWLFGPSLSRKDPFSFALGFESVHERYYRMEPEDGRGETVYLEGESPVLVTCPHSAVHVRMGKPKRHEFYTAALGTILHSALGCHCLYADRRQETDPNYSDDCGFKNAVGKILSERKIELVVDLHGTGNERPEDLFPGAGGDGEFLLGNADVLRGFYSCAEKRGIPAGSPDVFPAARQMTVAKFAARRFSVPAIQVEISDRLRMPKVREEEFRNLVGFLLEFVGNACGERILRP